jgi:myo-inositol-1(or 4)-monophosphatase
MTSSGVPSAGDHARGDDARGDDETSHLWRVAEEACARGSEIVFAAAGSGGTGRRAESKGVGDWVTEADRASEDAIRSFLASATPDVPMLGEEAGGERGERFWAVDPLDGTTNFMIGFPIVAVSVGLVEHGRPLVGSVRAPLLGLAFGAARGRGAWAGEQRLAVGTRPAERAIVATGFPFRRRELRPRHAEAFERVLRGVEDVRRAGAAALDLAWVASGVFDAYFELAMSVWDLAAGALLVEEAGGSVSGWDGDADHLVTGDVVAGSPSTYPLVLDATRRARP